jgi:uncharacterized membrane protein AbrB (regulator of aidB expression)
MTVALITFCMASVFLTGRWPIALLLSTLLIVGVCGFTRFNPIPKMLGSKKPDLEG